MPLSACAVQDVRITSPFLDELPTDPEAKNQLRQVEPYSEANKDFFVVVYNRGVATSTAASCS